MPTFESLGDKGSYFFRNEIKKGSDARRQMLAVCTDGEEVDFVTPEFAQALDNRARSEFGLEIPSCFQGNPFTRAQPVMHHLTTGRTQGSVDDHFKAFALILEEPCVHH